MTGMGYAFLALIAFMLGVVADELVKIKKLLKPHPSFGPIVKIDAKLTVVMEGNDKQGRVITSGSQVQNYLAQGYKIIEVS